ncbi:hypothetical protein IJJ97_05590 [bacterium]|nr:hypothetical protein [bacterium]
MDYKKCKKIIGLAGHSGADFRKKLMQKCIFSFKTGPILLDLLVKGFQLWEPGNKSRNIWIRKKWKTPLWMVCAQMRTKTMRERRNPGKKTSKIQESTTGGTL